MDMTLLQQMMAGAAAAKATKGIKRLRDENDGDMLMLEKDDGTAPHHDFTTSITPVRAPAHIHHETHDADLHTGALWSIDVTKLPSDVVRAHLDALTCVPNKDKKHVYGPPSTFTIGHVACGRLFMPPVYASIAFPDAIVTCTTLTVGEPMRTGAQFVGNLWQSYPPQQAAVDTFAQWMADETRTCHAAMISLPCGHGKSVVSLAIAACVIRHVTLVLVHMCGLVGQWIDEARLYVPGARIGYITADAQRVDGVDIIIASIHSLRSHIARKEAYVSTLIARVGFVILDEAHHGVANTFQQVMAHLPAKWRMAVTATPRRADGLFQELQWIFGPVVFQSFRR